MYPNDTREIPLTQGRIAIVDAADYEWLSQWNWQAHSSNCGRKWYARRNVLASDVGISQRNIVMHKVLLPVAKGLQVDHINGDSLDNRRSNLRPATNAQNSANIPNVPVGKSGYRGVHQNGPSRWQAMIRTGGKNVGLGTFDTAIEAAVARDSAARQLRGDFAILNFPD